MTKDSLQTFLFEDTDIRGAIVHLDDSLQAMVSNHGYHENNAQLLAKFALANLLMTSHLKFEGLLSLQARGHGSISLAMSECTHNLEYRGIIDGEASRSADFGDAISSGTLAITIMPARGNQYQGIVPLEHNTLAECLQAYFQQSEQLPSWFYFSVSEGSAFGIMLQALPPHHCLDQEKREDDWSRVVYLAETITREEAFSLSTRDLLYRLYHEDKVRLFEPRPVKYQCSCSRERMERGLLSLGHDELMSIAEELGEADLQCHFCNQRYVFSRGEILQLLQGGHS